MDPFGRYTEYKGDKMMKKKISIGIALALACMGGWSVTLAADPPDAAKVLGSQLERTGERNRDLQSYYKYSQYKDIVPQKTEVAVEKEKEESGAGEVLQFDVKEIRVTQSALLTPDEVRKAVHFKGPGPMTVEELQAIVSRLNALYEEKGIATAQAVLPPQTVTDGVVYIRLIEGRYGDAIVEGNKRVHTDSILSRIKIQKGELTSIDQLQDQLRVYNNTNTWQIQAELIPGKEQGTSDVRLVLHEPENPWTSFLFTDNAGQKESGRYRIGAYTELRGIGGVDASLAVAPVWTEGTWGGSVIYDTPIGTHGTRMTASYSRNIVNIIDGAFKDFDMKSNSNDMSLTITQPLNITDLSKVDFFIEGHRKWSDTVYSGMELADNSARTVKTGVNFRSFDANGLWFGMVSVTGFEANNNFAGTKSGGSYYNAYLMRRKNLPGDRYLMYRLMGQHTAFEQIPSTEQFSIGGMATVRGYKEGLLSGDEGWYASMEYGIPVSADHRTWRSFLFLDHGVVYSNYSVTGTQKDYITSTGIGLEYAKGGWYGKAVLGIPLKDSGNMGDNDVRVHFYIQRNI